MQANLNALTNRGNEPKANKKLGIWGGIKSKKRKSNNNKRKSKKRKSKTKKSKRRYN